MIAEIEIRTEPCGKCLALAFIKNERIGRKAGGESLGEIHLKHIAGPDKFDASPHD